MYQYVLNAVACLEGASNAPRIFSLATSTLPKNDAELETLLSEEARICLAELGDDGMLDYAYLIYSPVPGHPCLGSCGNTFIFFTEDGEAGCLPQAEIHQARALFIEYFDDLVRQEEAWNSPEHQEYLESLCAHSNA